MRLQHLSSFRGDAVIAPAALTCLLDPATGDPSALLETIEQGVEGGDMERQRTLTALFDDLANLIAMTRAHFDERKDQQVGATLLQFPVEHRHYHIWHKHIHPKKSRGQSEEAGGS